MGRLREDNTRYKEETRLDRQREREEHAARIDEKVDEARTMHGQLEAARNRADHASKETESARIELESAKTELGFRSDQADELKNTNHEMHAEVTRLKRSHEQAAELRENLRHTENEKEELLTRLTDVQESLQHKVDHGIEQLNNLRATTLEKESRMKMAEAELSAIKASHSTVETISRDNEKMKGEIHTLTNSLLQANHEASDAKRDSEHLTITVQEREKKIELLEADLVHWERENAALGATKDELSELLRTGAEKHSGMDAMLAEIHRQTDATLQEHKDVASAFKKEVEVVEERYVCAEKELLQLQGRHAIHRHDYITTLQTHIENLEQWDETLSDLVEGVASTNRDREVQALEDTTHSITRALSLKGFLNKGTSDNIKDEDISAHFVPVVTALTERIKIKMRRASRLRSHLTKQMEEQATQILNSFDSSDQRVQLLSMRVTESTASVDRVSTVMNRDRRLFEHEQTENKDFRGVLLEKHADALRAAQARLEAAIQVGHQAEEKQQAAEREHGAQLLELSRAAGVKDAEKRGLEQVIASKDSELAACEERLSSQQAEIEAYGQAEAVVQQLSDRLQELVADKEEVEATRDELAAQLEAGDARFDELQAQHENLQAELQSVLQERHEVKERLQAQGAQLNSQQQALVAADEAIATLKASQITPELAQMIADTQSIVTSTRNDHEQVLRDTSDFATVHAQTLHSPTQASAPPQQQYHQQQYQPQQLPPQPPQQEQEQEQQRMSQSQLQSQQRQASPGLTTGTPLGSMLGSSSGYSNAKGNYSGSAPPTERRESSAAKRSVFFSSSSRAAPDAAGPASSAAPSFIATAMSPRVQTYLRSPPNFTTGSSRSTITPPRAFLNGTASASASATSARSTLRSPMPAGTPLQSVTPSTQARQSVSRLHKLGSDIEALARKLDGFDASDRNKWGK